VGTAGIADPRSVDVAQEEVSCRTCEKRIDFSALFAPQQRDQGMWE
jgi:hypothetical protein